MKLVWLLRMSKWARHPASAARVRLVFTVVAICLVLWGIEQLWGWPDFLRVNGKAGP